MKILIFTVCCILAINPLLAQKTDTVVFKGATKIIIENTETAQSNFNLLGQSLVDNGYVIDSKDSEFGQITTKPFQAVFGKYKGSGLTIVAASLKDKRVVLSAQYDPVTNIRVVSWADNKSTFKPASYLRTNVGLRVTFQVMENLAKSIPHNKIIYSE